MKGTLINPAQSKLRALLIFLATAASFMSGIVVATTLQTRPSTKAVLRAEDLTGTWLGDDGGTYYLREIDNTLWWIGLDGAKGSNFSNVFYGTREGNVIKGPWADVPRGRGMNHGYLTLAVVSTERGIEIVTKEETGNFGGSRWSRTTATTLSQQSNADSEHSILSDGTIETREPDGSIRQYHPDGSETIINPDGTKQPGSLTNSQPLSPPLSFLSDPNFRPWLESHNQDLLGIIQGRLKPGEKEQLLMSFKKSEGARDLYQQVDFRTGAILSMLRRRS